MSGWRLVAPVSKTAAMTEPTTEAPERWLVRGAGIGTASFWPTSATRSHRLLQSYRHPGAPASAPGVIEGISDDRPGPPVWAAALGR